MEHHDKSTMEKAKDLVKDAAHAVKEKADDLKHAVIGGEKHHSPKSPAEKKAEHLKAKIDETCAGAKEKVDKAAYLLSLIPSPVTCLLHHQSSHQS